MLWYKAWRESRARFLVAAAALVVFVVWFMLTARTAFPPPQNPALLYTAFVYGYIWNPGPRVFVFVALVLGLGGLQRERAHATSAVTLALPISRLQLAARPASRRDRISDALLQGVARESRPLPAERVGPVHVLRVVRAFWNVSAERRPYRSDVDGVELVGAVASLPTYVVDIATSVGDSEAVT